MADVNSDAKFEGDTEVIKDGAFLESEYRSAPYFDIDIDGVTTK
jgi:basic membrane protein A